MCGIQEWGKETKVTGALCPDEEGVFSERVREVDLVLCLGASLKFIMRAKKGSERGRCSDYFLNVFSLCGDSCFSMDKACVQ